MKWTTGAIKTGEIGTHFKANFTLCGFDCGMFVVRSAGRWDSGLYHSGHSRGLRQISPGFNLPKGLYEKRRPSGLPCSHYEKSVLFFRGFVNLADFGPVHDVPPTLEIVRAFVLVLKIIGMLPNIAAEDGLVAIHEWIVLVRRAGDF